VSGPLAPMLLWAAGLVCAAVGLRVSRAGGGRAAPRAPGEVPGVLRAASRPPWPPAAVARLGRATDGVALVRAGLADALAPDALARMRAGLAGAGLVLSSAMALLIPSAAVMIPLAAGGGVAVPGRWIARRAAARRAALVRELPDLLDLLGICIEAGMALDPALRLAADRLGGTLGEEVGVVLRDLSLGAPRRDAYRGLVERAGAPEMTRTIGALLQAEELGAPLSRALQGQAESLRASRRQDARERAARAAPKIQLIVAMVMVPAVLLLVLGVLVIELSRQVGAVIG
jgi:tight adherence protein C